jgi:hypothetical protein
MPDVDKAEPAPVPDATATLTDAPMPDVDKAEPAPVPDATATLADAPMPDVDKAEPAPAAPDAPDVHPMEIDVRLLYRIDVHNYYPQEDDGFEKIETPAATRGGGSSHRETQRGTTACKRACDTPMATVAGSVSTQRFEEEEVQFDGNDAATVTIELRLVNKAYRPLVPPRPTAKG